ncbi:MAG: ImmA/IrrE family metallo-endopeptidase [Desulfobacteraceae bacterium]|jgi:Zn-dependent peptidase ImmA (M78 family)
MTNELSIDMLKAENTAAKIIEEYGITEPEHIRVRDIAFTLKATVVEKALKRAAASIVKVGEYSTIRISPFDNKERKRFSIAHELGHLVLEHVHSLKKVCSDSDMMSWYSDTQETQANFFASELILPKKLVEKRCDVKRVNLEPVRKIAKDFRASLTATAIKFVRLSPEQCAVVLSTDGKIKWSYRSEDWQPFIRKGKPLDPGTAAYDFFRNIEIPDEPIGVDGEVWVENDNVDLIIEHSFGAKEYGFVLSILWIKP